MSKNLFPVKVAPAHWAEIASAFLWLGLTAFGGPAAHIGIMQDEFVRRRKWLDDRQFLDLLSITNLIPGPNSTEMAMHIGYLRAGIPGSLLAGAGFIFPSMLMTMLFAWLYVQLGALPQINGVLYGIKPVVIAIIFNAFLSFAPKILNNWKLTAIGLAVMTLYLLGINELVLLAVGGIGFMLYRNWRKAASSIWLAALPDSFLPAVSLASKIPYTPQTLFFTFLKIGAVLYGSGYVLLAFLHSDFVQRLGWITDQQLLDAVAVGQVTPGPLSTAATFIGFLMDGIPGALLATLAFFLPAVLLVWVVNPLVPVLRSSPWTSSLLDGLNAASLGLMAAVILTLVPTSLPNLPAGFILAIAALFLVKWKVNATWLILAGGLAGWLLTSLG